MKKEVVNILIADGGAGDLICSLVATHYNITHYPNVQFLVWVPDYLLSLTKHLLPKGISIRNFTDAKTKYNASLPGVSTKWSSFHTPMRTHPVDYGFHMLSDRHVYNLNEKNYLSIRPEEINLFKYHLPEKYVVLCAAAAEKVKEMPVDTMNQLIDYVIEKGYVPVFLGRTKSETGVKNLNIVAKPLEINYNKGINLLDKTDLLEAAGIMNNAKCVIGMDGGLIHVAGCTNTNIVSAYTIASPEHLAPIRNGSQSYKFWAVEPDNVLNKYYQTNNNFNYGQDYRKFPGWEKVVETITAEKFINILENIL